MVENTFYTEVVVIQELVKHSTEGICVFGSMWANNSLAAAARQRIS